jgi:tetratricopeptide (TPR) repeat protein
MKTYKLAFHWALLFCLFMLLILKVPHEISFLEYFQYFPNLKLNEEVLFNFLPKTILVLFCCVFIKELNTFSWNESLNFLGFKNIKFMQLLVGLLLVIPLMVFYYVACWEGLKENIDIIVHPDVLVCSSAVFGILFEEIVFRGFFFQLLRPGRSFLKTAALSGFLWALLHLLNLTIGLSDNVDLGKFAQLFFRTFVSSFSLAYLFERFGNAIWGCLIVHIGIDSVLFIDLDKLREVENRNLLLSLSFWGCYILLNILAFPIINRFSRAEISNKKLLFRQPTKFNFLFENNLLIKRVIQSFSFFLIIGFIVLVSINASKAIIFKLAYYQRVAEINPNDPQSHYQLSGIYYDLGRYEDVVQESQKAIDLKPNYSEAYFRWGGALAQLGRFQEAGSKFEKAIMLNPLDNLSYDYWGAVLISSRKYDEAIAKLQTAIKINPNDDFAYNYWGFALEDLGKNDEAIQKFKKVIKIGKDRSLIKMARTEVLKLSPN